MSNLPPAGRYPGKLNGQIVVYVAKPSGSLCAALPVAINNEQFNWEGKHTMVLVGSDGTPNANSLSTLCDVFGWDGIDPFWLMFEDPETEQTPRDLSAVGFSLVCEHELYTEEGKAPRNIFKIKWLNPLNRTAPMPTKADRSDILARFGDQFRALAGSKPKTTTAPTPVKPPVAQSAPTPPPGPPKPAAPPCSMEEAWTKFATANPGVAQQALTEKWYVAVEKMFPGRDQTELTPAEWGNLKQSLQ